jgi:hypothetical protein
VPAEWPYVGVGSGKSLDPLLRCGILRDLDRPGVFVVHPSSIADTYSIRLLGPTKLGTSVLFAYQGYNCALPGIRPAWEEWLPEIDPQVVSGLQPQSAVGEQIREIQRVTGLGDAQLASTFPGGVSRETVNRWRNRSDPNLRPENVYRLGLLYELAKRVDAAGVDARVWLHEPIRDSSETPYQLICTGRLGDVRAAIEAIGAGLASAAEPMRLGVLPREVDEEIAIEDEGDWYVGESGDAGE